ncbi:MAG: hypothetical protein FWB95_07485 [Treponema sp.]|nr:hypothetical protein [Treponema sp.]
MNRKQFVQAYSGFIKSFIKLNRIAVRHGFSAMEIEVEDVDFEDFRMGLRLLIDKVDPGIIDEKFTNLIQFTKDKLERQFRVIVKRAIQGMQKKERASIIIVALNSYANLSKEEENQIDNLLVHENEPDTEKEFNEDMDEKNLDVLFSKVILNIDQKKIKTLLKEIDSKDLAKSLKNQDNAVKEKIFCSLSKRAAFTLEEDIDYMNPETNEIAEAQGKIVDIVSEKLKTGEIE